MSEPETTAEERRMASLIIRTEHAFDHFEVPMPPDDRRDESVVWRAHRAGMQLEVLRAQLAEACSRVAALEHELGLREEMRP